MFGTSDEVPQPSARSVMIQALGIVLLFAIGAPVAAGEQQTAVNALVGTWQMVSRIDRDVEGNVIPEPSLGSDPVGYLIYDAAGHVSVQLMSRHRPADPCQVTASAAADNVGHVGGYDSFFGRYMVDAKAGTVTHILEGAISPGDVGRSLTRRFKLLGDTLTLEFEPGGVAAGRTRTLTWRRVSP